MYGDEDSSYGDYYDAEEESKEELKSENVIIKKQNQKIISGKSEFEIMHDQIRELE